MKTYHVVGTIIAVVGDDGKIKRATQRVGFSQFKTLKKDARDGIDLSKATVVARYQQALDLTRSC